MKLIILGLVLLAMALGVAWKIDHELALLEKAHKITEPPKADESTDKGRRGTKSNPVVVKVLPASDHEAQTRRARDEQYEKSRNEVFLVWATVALALFTLALAFFTAFLWSSTSDLVRDAKVTSKKELRAYVLIYEARLSRPIGPPGPIVVIYKFRNFGTTPAYDLVLDCNICVLTLGQNISVPAFEPNAWAAKSIVGPRAAMENNFNYILNPADALAIASGSKVLYLSGEIRYVDIFKDAQVTKFRMMHGVSAGAEGIGVTFAPEGNEAT